MVEGTAAQQIPQELLSSSPKDDSRSRDNSRGPKSKKAHEFRNDSPLEPGTPVLHDQVRATLAPFSPTGSGGASPRPSGEWGRSSMDVGRRSMDVGRKSIDLSRKSIDTSTRFFSRVSFDRGRRSASTNTNRRVSSIKYNRNESPSTVPQGSTDSFVQSLDQGPDSSVPNLSGSGTQASGSQILDRSDVFESPTLQRRDDSPARDGEDRRRNSLDSIRRRQVPTHIQIRPPTRSQTDKSRTESAHEAEEREGRQLSQANSSPTLQQLVKAGGYPLQKAAGFGAFLRSRSKRMSNILAAESMGYVEKVSGMLAGGRKHYTQEERTGPEDGFQGPNEEVPEAPHGERFRAHFALPESEKLQATYFAYLHRVLPLYGKI